MKLGHHRTAALWVAWVLFAWLGGTASAGNVDMPLDEAYEGVSGTLLFSLPVGSPIGYSGDAGQLKWGPTGFAVDEEFGIWIGDGAGKRLVRFDRTGNEILSIDPGHDVVGIGDIAVAGTQVVLLDSAALAPNVYVYDRRSGDLVDRFDVPESAGLVDGLSGVGIAADGSVFVELNGGLTFVTVGRLDASGSPIDATPFSTNRSVAGDVTIEPSLQRSDHAHRAIQINGATVSLEGAHPLVTVMLAGATAEHAFVTVDELGQSRDGTLQVDSTVRKYERDGTSAGVARIPRRGLAVQMAQPVAVTPDGEVLAVVPRPSGIDVVSLTLTPSVDSVLPVREDTLSSEASQASEASPASCLSRSTMLSIAQEYLFAMAWLNSTNINGACAGRETPSYLGGADQYMSVPYKWGGFNTVAEYKGNMDPKTGRAGNTSKAAGVLACAYGVDCSGYVSRVWRLSVKKGTTNLASVSFHIEPEALLSMDLFNKYDVHAMLYRSASGNGFNVADSTTTGNLDRVVFRQVTATYADGFETRRFNNVCP